MSRIPDSSTVRWGNWASNIPSHEDNVLYAICSEQYQSAIDAIRNEPEIALFQDYFTGNTALHLAYKFGTPELVEFLIPYSNVNTKNKEGKIAIDYKSEK